MMQCCMIFCIFNPGAITYLEIIAFNFVIDETACSKSLETIGNEAVVILLANAFSYND